MVVPSVFELNSIKDQLALLKALSSHIDLDREERDPEYEQLLVKMNNTIRNLRERHDELKKLLES